MADDKKDTKSMAGRGSRRHPTNKEHYESVRRWQDEHSKEAKQVRAEVVAEEAAKRTPQEQLARLDAKLGVGVGAKKERARLMRRIASGDIEAEGQK